MPLPPENKGKVIIRAVPDEVVKEKLVAFICGNCGTTTPDMVRGKLARLPLILAGSIDPSRGERLAATLNAIGAEAAFVVAEAEPVPPLEPAVTDRSTVPQKNREEAQSAPPAERAKCAPRGTRSRKAPPTAAEEQHRIALACRIALVYALLACMAAMVSPLFHLFSVPLALYSTHRVVALLGVSIWLRAVFLPGLFVPFLNLFVLALMLLFTQLFLRRSKVPSQAIRDELASFRFVLRAGYAAFMVTFLLGSANGYLPQSMNELQESVEHRLEKEVSRSAKDFPRTVNKELRIDNMTAGPARRLTFNCTLLNYRASTINADRFRTDIKGSVIKEICDSKEMRFYLNKDVIISYAFSGNDGVPLATVDVANADCGK